MADTTQKRLTAAVRAVAAAAADANEAIDEAREALARAVTVPGLVADRLAELSPAATPSDLLNEVGSVLQRWDETRAEHPDWTKYVAVEVAALALHAIRVGAVDQEVTRG